jgi:hypothetical protein
MWRQIASLSILALTLFAAPRLEAQWTLDPEPEFEEFRAEAAVQPDGDVLLTWTRQLEPGGDWSVVAATLDPGSGQLGEVHEWGEGGDEQAVSLGSGAAGYLAVRQDLTPNPDWMVEHLDASGRAGGTVLPLGFVISAVAHPTPGGGAIVVAGGAGGTGGPARAWRFGSDGTLLAGPVTLADSSIQAAAGTDAAGNLVLVWTDQGTRVFSRRFSPDLQPLGPEVPAALGGAYGIRVAVAPDGRLVVVYDQSGRLWARPFRADGSPAGGRILLSPRTEYVDQENLDVAMAPDGRVLLVWKVYENLNVPTVRARFLSLNGRPEGKAVRLAQIRRGSRGDLLRPRTESLPAGDFLVLWTRVDAAGQKLTLQGRRFR